jgi:hypothetical protein
MSIDALFEQANPRAASASITIKRPDDWHVHLRDGAMLKAVLPFTAAQFARGIIMQPGAASDERRCRGGLSGTHSCRAACRSGLRAAYDMLSHGLDVTR